MRKGSSDQSCENVASNVNPKIQFSQTRKRNKERTKKEIRSQSLDPFFAPASPSITEIILAHEEEGEM